MSTLRSMTELWSYDKNRPRNPRRRVDRDLQPAAAPQTTVRRSCCRSSGARATRTRASGPAGGWLDPRRGLERAASRTLAETTTLTPSYLEQLYAFGDPGRSPGRVVSIVYWALVREDVSLESEQHNVAWFDATALPNLAFDHNQIVDYALWRLRNKVGYSRIAHGLLPDLFTLADLREVYEAILGRRLDPANFRRQVENSDPHPDRRVPHRQPPAGASLPLQPRRRARRPRAPPD
jgi:hypothetical protein